MWFFWLLTFLATIAAGLELAFTIVTATSAPQQAAGAALAIAIAVIPYVATRSLEGEVTARWRKQVGKALDKMSGTEK